MAAEDHFLMLLTGARYEGHGDTEWPVISEGQYSSVGFQAEYSDALTSLVLFGAARSCLPDYLARTVYLEDLASEELAEVIVFDDTAGLRRAIAHRYEHGYRHARELESNRASSALLWFDDKKPITPREGADAELSQGELSDCILRLFTLIDPLVQGTRDIFGYYLDQSAMVLTDTYASLNSDAVDSVLRRAPWVRRSDDEHLLVFDEMGLTPRDGLTLEAKLDCTYNPNDFDDFIEWDRLLTTPGDSFADASMASVRMAMTERDPVRFLRVHCFWRALFALANTLVLSERTGSPLFLPSSAEIRPHPVSRYSTTQDTVRIYRIVLAEKGMLPAPTSIDEVLRLREDPHLSSLQRALREWTENQGQREGDERELVEDVRLQLESARSQIRRLDTAAKVADIVGYVALPVAIADWLSGGLAGLALTPISPAISGYREWRLRKIGWVGFNA